MQLGLQGEPSLRLAHLFPSNESTSRSKEASLIEHLPLNPLTKVSPGPLAFAPIRLHVGDVKMQQRKPARLGVRARAASTTQPGTGSQAAERRTATGHSRPPRLSPQSSSASRRRGEEGGVRGWWTQGPGWPATPVWSCRPLNSSMRGSRTPDSNARTDGFLRHDSRFALPNDTGRLLTGSRVQL